MAQMAIAVLMSRMEGTIRRVLQRNALPEAATNWPRRTE